MQKRIHTAIFLFMFTFLHTAYGEEIATSSVEHVNVSYDGAWIDRIASVNLQAGESQWIISGLPGKFDKKEKQLKAKIDASGAVVLEVEYLKPDSNTWLNISEGKAARDSFVLITREIRRYEGKLENIMAEKEMVYANKRLRGADGIFLEDLEDMAAFMRIHLGRILDKELELKDELNELHNHKKRLHKSLEQQYKAWENEAGRAMVNVHARTRTPARIIVTYFTSEAGWMPVYHANASRIDRPVRWEEHAGVWQKTGQTWENATISLQSGSEYKNSNRQSADWALSLTEPKSDSLTPAYSGPRLSKTTKLSGRHTIRGDGRKKLLQINNNEITCDFKFKVNPKKSENAVMTGNIFKPGMEKLPNGELMVFFNDRMTYQGKFRSENLDPAGLKLNFGSTSNVTATQSIEHIESKSRLFSSDLRHTYTITTEIKNKSDNYINVILSDHIPVLDDEAISKKIKHGNYHPEINDKEGTMQWTLKLEPYEHKTVTYDLTLRHPGDKKILGF